jgi:pyruvate dehydrogenase E1 component alpha subunit
MLKSRLFEQAIAQIWKDGLVSGEMHLGTGEEAVHAGVVSQLRDGDAMALDHRATAPLLMRGVDPALMLREMLGKPDGLCGGLGGHMHLFSRDHLAASSGIVGAAGPVASGFAVAALSLRPGSVAAAFFGEGAMNQGMLLESLNLASAWRLPVVFVCKDDGWSITTRSNSVTGGKLSERARGFGLFAVEIDGLDVLRVWEAAREAIDRARAGQGPSFLHASCVHLEGHFLGYPLLRILRDPVKEMPAIAAPLARAFVRPGGESLRDRLAGAASVLSNLMAALRDPRRDPSSDPVARARVSLESDSARLRDLEHGVEREVNAVLAAAMGEGVS